MDVTPPVIQDPPVYRAAGVISLCCVVCRQNRGCGRILDTGITCLSWSSPTRCHAPPPTPDLLTTGSTSIQRSWSYLSLLGCFQPKFDVFCKRIVLGQCVAVWCCWINVWQDVWSSYLSTCPPPPTPLSLFCLCHGPKWCIKIFYFVHENPRWTRIMVYFLFHDKLSL